MSGDKTKLVQAKRASNKLSVGSISRSDKYHFTPKTVTQKRSVSCQNNTIDAEAYREYMDQQAEKDGWIEDKYNLIALITISFFISTVGSFLAILSTFRAIFVVIFCISSVLTLKGLYALQLRGGSNSLTPRSKGGRR